ncbi:glycosyltransferase family 2 protein [Propionicimonas sp.]|uniref:glycosyltransferase family 2 protein n=1 Tax=Propionicimonas sp. TaxID=1955623 RepID=UPI0018143222|nr:glycosyltransferase family 2 protein [Propionicimonas sp.]MBU3975710.1 glycosyltransferase [Actinomycetota bacterium]MBA3019887.1 glycosyltransferase family 2 protein [Propionicimonas sp.]MBU3986141.1 glycosyltransferase [Actinomycetota bacterium]MBU4007710.1 glycosyltransferase [Actinomycetota bacterium]MBU4063968.1 glycosyltransferase [Actinomycetota bacterium]
MGVFQELKKRFGVRAPAASSGPLVSVIIPVYNVAEYVAECLDSLLGQQHRAIDVILVDDGSTDDSLKICRGYVKRHRQLRLVEQVNAGPGAARNAGAALARGEFLMFLDSDDRLPADALSRAVAAAEKHQAELVVAPLARFTSQRTWIPRWSAALHPRYEYFDSLEERPELLRNHYGPSKLYRRSLWQREHAAFREGVRYEDLPLSSQLLMGARGIVSLPEPIYQYREREDGSAAHQQIHTMRDLADRAQSWDAAVDLLTLRGSAAVRSAWLYTIYDTHVHFYLNSASIEQPHYWAALRQAITGLAVLGECTRPLTPAKRLALDLLADDRHQDYLRWWRAGVFDTDAQRYQVQDGRLRWLPAAELPADDVGGAVAVNALLPARVSLLNAAWSRDTLQVSGHHYLPGVVTENSTVQHRVELDNGVGVIVATARSTEPPVGPARDRGKRTFTADVPLAELSPGRYRLVVRTAIDGLELVDELGGAITWFSARVLPPARVGNLMALPRFQQCPAELEVISTRAWVSEVTAIGSELVLTLGGDHLSMVRLGGQQFVADDQGRLRLAWSALAQLSGPLTGVLADGSAVPLLAAGECDIDGPGVRVRPDAEAVLQVSHAPGVARAEVRFTSRQVTFAVQHQVQPGWQLKRVLLRARGRQVAAEPAGVGLWSVPLAAVGEGGYTLIAAFGRGSRTHKARVLAGARYLRALPEATECDGVRWRTLVAADGAIHLDARSEGNV